MEENDKKEQGVWASFINEFRAKKVADLGVFTIREKEFFLIKAFKYAVNYSVYGFVMFMTFVILSITLVAA